MAESLSTTAGSVYTRGKIGGVNLPSSVYASGTSGGVTSSRVIEDPSTGKVTTIDVYGGGRVETTVTEPGKTTERYVNRVSGASAERLSIPSMGIPAQTLPVAKVNTATIPTVQTSIQPSLDYRIGIQQPQSYGLLPAQKRPEKAFVSELRAAPRKKDLYSRFTEAQRRVEQAAEYEASPLKRQAYGLSSVALGVSAPIVSLVTRPVETVKGTVRSLLNPKQTLIDIGEGLKTRPGATIGELGGSYVVGSLAGKGVSRVAKSELLGITSDVKTIETTTPESKVSGTITRGSLLVETRSVPLVGKRTVTTYGIDATGKIFTAPEKSIELISGKITPMTKQVVGKSKITTFDIKPIPFESATRTMTTELGSYSISRTRNIRYGKDIGGQYLTRIGSDSSISIGIQKELPRSKSLLTQDLSKGFEKAKVTTGSLSVSKQIGEISAPEGSWSSIMYRERSVRLPPKSIARIEKGLSYELNIKPIKSQNIGGASTLTQTATKQNVIALVKAEAVKPITLKTVTIPISKTRQVNRITSNALMTKTGTSTLTAMDTKTKTEITRKQISRPSTKELSIYSTVSEQRRGLRELTTTLPISATTSALSLKTSALQGTETIQLVRTAQQQATKTAQLQKTSTITSQLFRTRSTTTKIRTMPLLQKEKRTGDKRIVESGKLSYVSYIKRKQLKKGKGSYLSRGYAKVPTPPTTKEAALGAAMQIADRYANRSILLRKANKAPVAKPELESTYARLRGKFRAAKRSGMYVEKARFAIDSPEERNAIPYEAARQRRAGLFRPKRVRLF